MINSQGDTMTSQMPDSMTVTQQLTQSEQQSPWQHSSPQWSITTLTHGFNWEPGVTLVEDWTVSVHALFFKLTGKWPDISHHSIFSYLDNMIPARSFVCSCLRARWCQDSFPHWRWTHRTLMGDCDCWWGQAFKEPGYPCMATWVWTHICGLALKGKSPEQRCLGNNRHTQHTDCFLFGLIDWLTDWWH